MKKQSEKKKHGVSVCVYLLPVCLIRASPSPPSNHSSISSFIDQPTQTSSSWVAAERSHQHSKGMQTRTHKPTPRSTVIKHPLQRLWTIHLCDVCYDWWRHLLLGQYHTVEVIRELEPSTEIICRSWDRRNALWENLYSLKGLSSFTVLLLRSHWKNKFSDKSETYYTVHLYAEKRVPREK